MSNENDVFDRSIYLVNIQNLFIEAEIGTQNNYFYEIGVGYNSYHYSYVLKDIYWLFNH